MMSAASAVLGVSMKLQEEKAHHANSINTHLIARSASLRRLQACKMQSIRGYRSYIAKCKLKTIKSYTISLQSGGAYAE